MKKEKNPINLMLAFFGIALVAVIPVRCYQFIKILEPGTGFYEKTDWSVWFLYIFIPIVCIALAVISLSKKKTLVYDNKPIKSIAVALAAFMLALTLIIDAVEQFGTAFSLLNNTPIFYGESVGLFKSGAAARVFEAIAAVICTVYFTIFGYGHITGKSCAVDNKLMALFPVIWCICRLMHRFMQTINYLNVSDLMFELFMCVILMLFFMAFAQLNSNVNADNLSWKLAAYGLPAALLCLLCFLPRFIMLITGRSDSLYTESPVEWCDLGCAVFIITLIMSRLGIASKKHETNSEAEN
ncbi:MAG: hypothetical protein IJF40_02270 [Clostridia bacterium]|nr:hypothetical protein [Clostridia bacterium]